MDKIEEYRKLEKNKDYLAEVESLIKNSKLEELQDILGSSLVFGTAGLRARMGPGFNRMNELTVIQATQGVASVLLKKSNKKVVIGYDHRHNSFLFAKHTVIITRCLKYCSRPLCFY